MTKPSIAMHHSRPSVSKFRGVLAAGELQGLAEVPPPAVWFANPDDANTGRSRQNDLQEFDL